MPQTHIADTSSSVFYGIFGKKAPFTGFFSVFILNSMANLTQYA
jgi:hypothetical protein